MAQKNSIQFSIDFKKGETHALDSLKKDLAEIQNIATKPMDLGLEAGEIQKMVSAARTLETSLDQAFDVDLNTVNIQKFNNLLKQSGMTAETLQADLSLAGATGQQAFLKMTGQLMQFNTMTKQTNKFLDSLATSFFNTVKWGAMSSIMNNIAGTVQKSFYYIKDLDRGLNDIRIVTGKSADEMERFAVTANDAAKALSVSTEDFTKGALIYYQQGLDDETATQLAEITAKTANVTGQGMDAVSEELTAVWNGYQVANQAAEEGMQVYEEYVDKMAAVGATTASDLEELSTAMSKVASAAAAMGVNFDDLNAQIATIVSVTRQAPESVGTALKTIYARLGDLKIDGVDEFGVKLGEVSQQLQDIGINVLDQNGNLRDMSDVIKEVASAWGGWTEAQRQAAAVAMAGKRQYNNLIALFDNQDMHEKALATSMGAVGTLNEQQAIAAESLAKKMEKMSATAEDLYGNLFDEDNLIKLVEFGTETLQFLANFTESVGGLKSLLPAIGGIALQVFNEQIGKGLATIITNAQNANQQTQLMKDNFEQIKLAFSDAEIFRVGNSPAEEEAMVQAVQRIRDYYEEMYPYQASMTQEQKEQYNLILNTKIEAENLALKVAEQTESQKNANEHWKQGKNDISLFDGSLINAVKDSQKLTAEAQKISQAAKEMKDWFDGKSFQSIEDFNSRFSKLMNNIQETSGLSEAQIISITRKIRDANPAVEDLDKVFNKLIKDMFDLSEGAIAIDNDRAAIERMTNSTNTLDKSLKNVVTTEQMMANITKTLGSAGQFASALTTLQNIGKIADNENLNQEEKFLQLITNISFALPMAIQSIKTLKDGILSLGQAFEISFAARNASIALHTSNIALQEAENNALNNGTKALMEHSTILATGQGLEEARAATLSQEIINSIMLGEVTDKETLKEAINNATKEDGVIINEEAFLTYLALIEAKKRNNLETEKEILLQKQNKLAQLSNPYVLAVAAVVALTAAIAVLIYKENQRREQLIKTRMEEQAAFEERHKQVREEIQEQQDLAQSYIDLYSKYKEGNAEKSAMIEKTNSLIDILGEERVAVAQLTGDYESLNAEMLEYQKNQIQEKINQNTKEAVEQRDKIAFSSVTIENNQNALADAYNKMNSNAPGNYASLQGILTQYSQFIDGVEYIKYDLDFSKTSIEHLANNTGAILAALGGSGLSTSEIKTQLTTIQNLLQENQTLEVEKVTAGKDVSNIQSQDEYNKILEETVNELRETAEYSEKSGKSDSEVLQAAVQMLSGLSGNNEKYAQRALTEDYVINTKFADNSYAQDLVNSMMDDLSDEDLSLLIQGKVIIDKNSTEESVRKDLDEMQKSFAQEDLSIVSDLMSKIASDKKLTNKELEAVLAERNQLAKDYDTDLQDFERRSELEQVDILNGIIRDRIEANKEFATEGIKSYQEYVDEYEQKQSRYKELVEMEPRYKNEALEQEQKDLEEYLNANLAKYEDYYDTISNFDINNTVFDNLISGIDGIITEANILKDLAEEVGENWVIAADDVANFAKAFPEVIEAQQELNFTEDGSLQLTKEQQEVFQKVVEQRKADLIAQNEAYQLEMRKQADIAKATSEYYTKQADLLEANLNGEMSSIKTQGKMNENLANYKSELMKATGLDNEELTNLINDNMALTQTEAADKTSKIYEFWCAVGEAAQNASVAYANEKFEDPGKSNVFSGGTTKISANKFEGSGQAHSLVFDEEQQKELIEQYRRLAKESQDEYTDYESKIAGSQAQLDAAINAMDNAAAGKGGKGSKSSSKNAKSKDEKEYKDEFNRYFDIEKAIEDVDHAVKQLEKDQKNLHGKGLIESLQKENELIEKQTENYEKLYELQKEEAKELIGKLKGLGLTFDDSGAITNYAEATKKALDDYNKAVAQYNADQNDEVFEIHEKAYENFKKTLERYEDLYYKDMKDTQDKIDDNNRKILENNLKGWEVEIELRLNTNKMERDWNSFLRKINKDYKKVFKDLGQEMQDLQEEFNELGKDREVYFDELEFVTAEIDKMMAGEKSDYYGYNIEQAQKKLEELHEQIISNADDTYDKTQEFQDNYLDSIDEAADKLDLIKDGWEKINDELEFEKQLIELVYGEKAYDLMNTYYTGQKQALEGQLQSTKSIADTWHQLQEESGATMENRLDQNEDQKKYYEEWQEAQGELQDQLVNYIKLLKEDYLNTVDNILDKLDKKLFGNDGLDEIKQEQEKITWYSDRYLDDTEKAIEIETLRSKINEEIDKTDDVKIQQKLQKFRDKELKQLAEKKNLTEYDLKAAEARYQIQLKEIALEDSRNNKTSMKLTRNAQGNQSYQYVADEEEVENKQQELLDAQKDYYALTKEQMKKAYGEQIDMYSAYMDAIKEIAADDSIDEETRQKKMTKIKETYMGKLDAISEDYDVSREDSLVAAAATTLSVYEQNNDAYEYFTAEQKALTDTLVASDITDFMDLEYKVGENFNNMAIDSANFLATSRDDQTATATQIIEQQNGEGDESIKNQINLAIVDIMDASEEYRVKMNEVAESVGYDLGKEGIVGRIKDVETEEEILKNQTKKLTDDTHIFLQEQQTYIAGVTTAWGTVYDAVDKAIGKIEEYLKLQAKAGISGSIKVGGNIDVESIAPEKATVTGSKSTKANTIPRRNNIPDEDPVSETPTEKMYIDGPNGEGLCRLVGVDSGKMYTMGFYDDLKEKYGDYIVDGQYEEQKETNKKHQAARTLASLTTLATGGYTGDQGSDEGRLAVLHEKELVLNKDDTEKMLEAIKIAGQIDIERANQMEYALRKSIASMGLDGVRSSYRDYINSIGRMAESTGDTFYIDKLEFPNANNVDEIREAILTLPNIASQFVGRNTK